MACQLDLLALPALDPPPVDVQPDENGCYPNEHAERIALSRDKKGWQILPLAEITLIHVAAGWLRSVHIMLADRGSGYGLFEKWGVFPSRSAALLAARTEIVRFCAGAEDDRNPETTKREARALRTWVEGLAA